MTQPEADQILLNVANDRLKAICLALGGSETRVPYTHHHDYIRSRWPSHLSRSDVAQMAQAMGMERLHWASLAHVAEDAEPMALLSLDQEEPEVIITTYNPWRLYRAIQSHLVMASIVMADWYLNDLLATHAATKAEF